MQRRTIPGSGAQRYQEFIRSSDLSVGVYRLQPGDTDTQRPHREDEVYYVVQGRAKFTAGMQTVDVLPGACLFVAAGEPHHFHDILEALEVLVMFGPAEGTRSKAP